MSNEYQDYFHVVRIPKGAANIEITQAGYPMDENYIGKLSFFFTSILAMLKFCSVFLQCYQMIRVNIF